MKNKKKIIMIVVGVLVTIGIIGGVSYAWWSARATQQGVNTIKSDCLKINLTDENPISLESAHPITDKEAESITPYTFTVENICNTSIVYDVNLEVLETENRLKSEYIATSFNGGNKRILNVYPKVSTSLEQGVEAYGLFSGSLKGKEKATYTLKLWMNEHVTINDDAMNKNFRSKIVVNASLSQVVDTYTESILNGADPVLVDGLVPVEIENDGRVTKANTQNEWYNYKEKRWANAVILEDESIVYQDYEEIPEENIESYFVWIPKYSYQLWDLGEYSSLSSIDSNKVHTIPIKFGLTNTNDSVEGECTTPMTSGASGICKVGDYMTPPAFITMGTNGLWVGKFETGYKGATSTTNAKVNVNDSSKVQIKPNVYSWRNITVSNAFYTSYNYKRELDSHMMKNTEWGAVTYLTNSNYGKCTGSTCEEIYINNNNDFITGWSATSVSEGSSTTSGYKYSNVNSTKASTTGNYSGIYDMSGGAYAYVAGYVSGFTGTSELTPTDYDNKYFDVYNQNAKITTYQYRILGDATGEMGPYQQMDPFRITSWYMDASHFPENVYPWINRGGNKNYASAAGIFTIDRWSGGADENHGFRIVLAI